ncbi:hypothetical protein RJ640_028808 [Escallonia rubra]|uniref:CAP-Gly domain-containing protein n=1 Tax=Escallonia rubra TaxID=112253 RepID=A0AA88QWZ4_9ASTE|nr:hypothetical protein RJ640_028808 [Escallonia rubra]
MESPTPEPSNSPEFRIGQRVHSTGDSRRIGTVRYVGHVEGYSGSWVGVDWDSGDGKHDGSINGVRYFQAKEQKSGSFARPHNLSGGISMLQALEIRYRTTSTKEEDDEMYVLSASNKRVSVQLLGKEKIQDQLSRFEELTGASLFYLGVSSSGPPCEISMTIPDLKELDLTGNLLSDWKDVGSIGTGLPALGALNLSSNMMSHDITGMPQLNTIRILVLNNTGLSWMQVEVLGNLLPAIEELHLMGNQISELMVNMDISAIELTSSTTVQGFESLRLLNLEDNCLANWDEILKLSQLRSLEQVHLNKNSLNYIRYPDYDTTHKLLNSYASAAKCYRPFQNLCCLLLGGNNIGDLTSVDSLNSFPSLRVRFAMEMAWQNLELKVAIYYLGDVRLSENPVTDTGRGGIPRFVLIARLAKVEVLNGSEVRPRERKDSEIRSHNQKPILLNPFISNQDQALLKIIIGVTGHSFVLSGWSKNLDAAINLKCVGASIGEKPPLIKKLPGSTTVGKLKILCENFFKLKSIKPILFLYEEGSPLATLLDDDMASLIDLGVGNESTILVDEEH